MLSVMGQLVARIDDDLAREIDALVDEGVVASRSDAVRQALRALVDRHRRRRVAEETVAAYTAQPQTEDELRGVDEAARRMIEEEPW